MTKETKFEKAKREFKEMPFENRLKRFVKEKHIKEFSYYYYPVLITSADRDNRREKVYEFINSFGLKVYNDKFHNPGTDDYDMVIISQIKNPTHLYNIFLNHNFKFILFDTDKIFSSKWYIDLVEGAICVSPDSVTKWTIYKNGQKPFQFKGRSMFLTNHTYDYFLSRPKFKNILRDTTNYL